MIAPNTDIILYKTPIELDNLNQLKFDNFNSQWAWFSSLPRLFLDDATFQRKDGVIRFPTNDQITYDDLIQYNYCTYKNENYGPKVFFAFIKDIRYINDGMCEIEIKLDAWQTWQNDITIKKSFVEREHVNDDTFGKHTIPEGLDTGPYILQSLTDDEKDSFNYLKPGSTAYDHPIIVMAVSDTNEMIVPAGDKMYGNSFSGLYYLGFPTGADAENYISDLTSGFSSKLDSIYAIFMVPYSLVEGITFFTPADKNYEVGYVPYTTSETHMKTAYVDDNKILGKNYRPKNNKALCYPYRYITISNNAGTNGHYRYEYFQQGGFGAKNNECQFAIEGTVSIGCNIKCIPRDYNIAYTTSYADKQLIESIDAYKLPTCTWLTDPYLNWLSENSINIIGGTAVNVGEIIAGAAMMASNPAMGGVLAVGGASGILNTLKEGVQKALDPDTAHGGQNQGNYNYAKGIGFTPYKYSIRDEYAKIIDDYFTMFGYKVATLKVPELHSRRNWNYIKTIDINIIGDIPQADLQEIKSLFNNGITLWHDPNTFLDYSQSNYII